MAELLTSLFCSFDRGGEEAEKLGAIGDKRLGGYVVGQITGANQEIEPIASFGGFLFGNRVLVDEVGLGRTVVPFSDVCADRRSGAKNLLRHHALALILQVLIEPHDPKCKRFGFLKQRI